MHLWVLSHSSFKTETPVFFRHTYVLTSICRQFPLNFDHSLIIVIFDLVINVGIVFDIVHEVFDIDH